MTNMYNSSSLYSIILIYKGKLQEAVNNRFSSIIDFCQKNLLLTGSSNNKVKRPGLIDHNTIFKNPYNQNEKIIAPYSSGEESENEEECEHNPGIKDVIENMWDQNTIQQVESYRGIPKSARIGLIFSNIDDWMKAFDLKQFIEEIPVTSRLSIDIEEIRIFRKNSKHTGFVLFNNLSDCEIVYTFFNGNLRRKPNPCKNSRGEPIEVNWAYDKLDLKNSGWYGVILRNVPPKCTSENIQNQCSARGERVIYALKPQQIRSQFCSIVVLENLEDAEKLCITLNQKEIAKNKFLKVHLHPRCCKINNLSFLPQQNQVPPSVEQSYIRKASSNSVKKEPSDEISIGPFTRVGSDNQIKEKSRKQGKEDKVMNISVSNSNINNMDTSNILNSHLSNLCFPTKEIAKPYDIESNPAKLTDKPKVDTKSVMSNVQSALLNLIQKTNQVQVSNPNQSNNINNSNSKVENLNSSNTIINANNINIINTTINNDICISNNVFINSFPQKNESSKLQIFNNSTIQLTNSVPLEKQISSDMNIEKKKSDNNLTKEEMNLKEDLLWKNNNFYNDDSKEQEDQHYNNEGNFYRKKKFQYKKETFNNKEIINPKDIIVKRKYSFSSSESSSFVNKNTHLKRKKRKSSSRSQSSDVRGSREKKQQRKHNKKYRRSYSRSSRSASKSIDKIIFNNLPKEENKEREGEFYKKFLQRFNNKVQFEDYDRNPSRSKNYVSRKGYNQKNSYKKGYSHYEGKYKPNYK